MNIGRARFQRPPQRNRTLARELRRNLTPEERAVWRALRERLPPGTAHFRRQVALGPYIVDFCDLGTRTIVEIDGNQHGQPGAREKDALRDEFLKDQRFNILRFSNEDVRSNLTSVLDTIFEAVRRG